MLWEWIVSLSVAALWCLGLWEFAKWMDRKERMDR